MTEREQQRKIGHRPAVLRDTAEVTGNVSASCRYYGMSRPTFASGSTATRNTARTAAA